MDIPYHAAESVVRCYMDEVARMLSPLLKDGDIITIDDAKRGLVTVTRPGMNVVAYTPMTDDPKTFDWSVAVPVIVNNTQPDRGEHHGH